MHRVETPASSTLVSPMLGMGLDGRLLGKRILNIIRTCPNKLRHVLIIGLLGNDVMGSGAASNGFKLSNVYKF